MVLNRDTILRIIVCVHFIFISLVLMGNWLPLSYQLNQFTILVIGFWAIARRDALQVELLMLFTFISIILDSIAIGMYFQIGKTNNERSQFNTYFAFSALFAITLLLLKPIILLLLYKVREDRINDSTFGVWESSSGYTPVDGH